MKIAKINFSKMRNDAHFQLHSDFRVIVARHTPEALGIASLYAAYEGRFARVDEALKKIVKSALTEKIAEADRARDEVWHGLTEASFSALKHFDPETRDSAKRLKIVFDTYGNVAKKPFNEETSAIYNILQDLQGKYAPDVALVNVGRWVAKLKECNEAFASLMMERHDETAARCDIVLKEARAELDDSYRAIEERINALIVVNGKEAYEEFVRTLNAVIEKYKGGKRRHGSGGQGGSGADGAEEGGEAEEEITG